MVLGPRYAFRSPEDSPVQLASLASMSFDGCSGIYEGVEIAAEPVEWGGYNLHAEGHGHAWFASVPTRAMARAMFASFVRGDHRGWVAFDDDGPTDPASFTAGPGPATIGAYVWVRDDGVHGWFDADDDRAAMAEARRLCVASFDRRHVSCLSVDVYRTGVGHSGPGYLVGLLELRSFGSVTRSRRAEAGR